jgi:hypothetical protein
MSTCKSPCQHANHHVNMQHLLLMQTKLVTQIRSGRFPAFPAFPVFLALLDSTHSYPYLLIRLLPMRPPRRRRRRGEEERGKGDRGEGGEALRLAHDSRCESCCRAVSSVIVFATNVVVACCPACLWLYIMCYVSIYRMSSLSNLLATNVVVACCPACLGLYTECAIYLYIDQFSVKCVLYERCCRFLSSFFWLSDCHYHQILACLLYRMCSL